MPGQPSLASASLRLSSTPWIVFFLPSARMRSDYSTSSAPPTSRFVLGAVAAGSRHIRSTPTFFRAPASARASDAAPGVAAPRALYRIAGDSRHLCSLARRSAHVGGARGGVGVHAGARGAGRRRGLCGAPRPTAASAAAFLVRRARLPMSLLRTPHPTSPPCLRRPSELRSMEGQVRPIREDPFVRGRRAAPEDL